MREAPALFGKHCLCLLFVLDPYPFKLIFGKKKRPVEVLGRSFSIRACYQAWPKMENHIQKSISKIINVICY